MVRLLPVGLLLVALAACSSVPVTTMWQLRDLDPMALEPTEVRAAMRVPVRIGTAGINSLKLDLTMKTADGANEVSESIELERLDTVLSGHLRGQRKEGYEIAVFALSDSDTARIRAFQQTAKAWKARYKDDLDFDIGLSYSFCRTGQANPGAPLPFTSYIKISGEKDFLTLTKELDMRKQVAGGGPEVITACDA